MRERVTLCKRCGKPIATLTQSIWGANDARDKYAGICEDCITEEERQSIKNMVIAAIVNTMFGGSPNDEE